MFRVQLRELERAGKLHVRQRIPGDDELWEGADLSFVEAVDVELELTLTATDQVLARGRIETVLRHQCRRCLIEVDRSIVVPVEWVWSPPDALSDEEGDGVRELSPNAAELELGDAIREELILAAPMFVLCREDCRGLCPRCGTNWNEGECDCTQAEPDSRWAALRALDEE